MKNITIILSALFAVFLIYISYGMYSAYKMNSVVQKASEDNKKYRVGEKRQKVENPFYWLKK